MFKASTGSLTRGLGGSFDFQQAIGAAGLKPIVVELKPIEGLNARVRACDGFCLECFLLYIDFIVDLWVFDGF